MNKGEILEDGWRYATAPSQDCASPSDAQHALPFIQTQKIDTLAAMLINDGAWSWSNPPDLDSLDLWMERDIEGIGDHSLLFEGLATQAEIYLDNQEILRSQSMFCEQRVRVLLSGAHRLTLCFRALRDAPKKKGRARWRPRMIQPGDLRFHRTSALGHMPGFAPPAPIVGAWRPIRLIAHNQPRLLAQKIHSAIDGDGGTVSITLTFDQQLATPPIVFCDGGGCALVGDGSTYYGRIHLSAVEKWFPHTHGEPRLYEVTAQWDGDETLLAKVGFRSIVVDKGRDAAGFKLVVNGAPIFCRGAVWTPLDPISLRNDPDALSRQIALAVEAGVNMFRVSGVFVYETLSFYRACDEAGILVFQDFMFANFDYPVNDEDFQRLVETEVQAFLARTQFSPALAALCGGNEVYQQASMLGIGEALWRSPLYEEILPALAKCIRPDVPYIANSPSGGALPFHSNVGIAHYYGVGAYRRPLDDARRAHVRFASECLGFANVPEKRTLREDFGPAPLSSPLWAARIPRDQGAMQDFEQVRDHYIGLLYGVDPLEMKERTPALYLDFSRAAVAETIETTVSEWRRPHSSCAGALVWFWKDLWASSGWGVIDWRGRPKSPLWAMKRAFRPVQILLSDEGVNGLMIHCVNERPKPFLGRLTLRCYKDGATLVMNGEHPIALEAHGAISIADTIVWGGFFDTAYAYRFGPPSHEVTIATLYDDTDAIVAEAFHFPLGRSAAQYDAQLSVAPFFDAGGFGLVIETDLFAQSVKIEDARANPSDNWFHLPPGARRIVRFSERDIAPQGEIARLGGLPVGYAWAEQTIGEEILE